jgi:hypothetical protein
VSGTKRTFTCTDLLQNGSLTRHSVYRRLWHSITNKCLPAFGSQSYSKLHGWTYLTQHNTQHNTTHTTQHTPHHTQNNTTHHTQITTHKSPHTSHIWLTPGGSSTSHTWLTPCGSSTSHIRLTPGGSSTSHIYTQYTERKIRKCVPCPVFASYTLAFALQLRKRHGNPSVRVAQYT